MEVSLKDKFLTKARSLYEQQVDRISPYLGISGLERVELKEQVNITTFSQWIDEMSNKALGALGTLTLRRRNSARELQRLRSQNPGTTSDTMRVYEGDIRTIDHHIKEYEDQLKDWKNTLPGSMVTGDRDRIDLVIEDGVSENEISHIVGNEFAHLVWAVLAPKRNVNISVNECFELLVFFVHSFFAGADEEIGLIYDCAKNCWDTAVIQGTPEVSIQDDEVLFKTAYSILREGKSEDDIKNELYKLLYEEKGMRVFRDYGRHAVHGETWLNMENPDEAAVERFLDAVYPSTAFNARQGEEMYIKEYGEPGHLIGSYLALNILTPPANWRVRKRDYHHAVLETMGEIIRTDKIDISEPIAFLEGFKAKVSEKIGESL